MTANQVILRWLNDTRDQFSNGRDQQEALSKLLDGFIDGRVLGYELDLYLRTRVLGENASRAKVPVEEVVRFVETHFRRELARLRACGVEEVVRKLVELTGMPNAGPEVNALIMLYTDGKPRRYMVSYEVRYGDNGRVANQADHQVEARTRYEAEQMCYAWVKDNDPAFDERIDPSFRVVSVADMEEIEDAAEEKFERDG